MTEYCVYCGGELLIERDCTHNTREPFEYCCPTCNTHFDGGGNIIEDFNEPMQPTPSTPTNPSDKNNKGEGQKGEQDSSQKSEASEGNTQTSTGESSEGKNEGESSQKDTNDFKLEPTQILASQKVLKQIESLQQYLATAMAS